MENEKKLRVNTYIGQGTVLFLRAVCLEHGLVSTTGRTTGEGSISALLERIAERLQDGALDMRVLA